VRKAIPTTSCNADKWRKDFVQTIFHTTVTILVDTATHCWYCMPLKNSLLRRCTDWIAYCIVDTNGLVIQKCWSKTSQQYFLQHYHQEFILRSVRNRIKTSLIKSKILWWKTSALMNRNLNWQHFFANKQWESNFTRIKQQMNKRNFLHHWSTDKMWKWNNLRQGNILTKIE